MGDSGITRPRSTDAFNVLVTGFGPFRQTTRNPSWETAKVLSKTGARSVDGEQIEIHASYMPAEYEYAAKALAYYHGNATEKLPIPEDVRQDVDIAAKDEFCPGRHYDLIIHIGQGRVGGIKLETIGHQLGYRLLDAADSLAPIVDETSGGAKDDLAQLPEQYMSEVERNSGLNRGYILPQDHGLDVADGKPLETSLDTESLAESLSKRFPQFRIFKSTNAGRYICEYTYFGSMAECLIARSRKSEASVPYKKLTKVLFVHVPPQTDSLTINEMADVVRALIEEVAK